VHPNPETVFAKRAIIKVPQITIAFWVIKILTTGMGETTSDFLVRTLDPPPTVAAAGGLLLAALAAQILSPRYSSWLYWMAVVLVSIFGTMVADVIHVFLGVPYAISTVAFALSLGAILFLWKRSESTLSIHSVSTRRRELYYWATILLTFALGTAVGDLTAATLGFGYLLSGILFVAMFAIPFIARRAGGIGEVGAFWTSYILTRPLGASFADWMGVSKARGGLDWGTGWVSLALGLAIVSTIAWLKYVRPAVPSERI